MLIFRSQGYLAVLRLDNRSKNVMGTDRGPFSSHVQSFSASLGADFSARGTAKVVRFKIPATRC